MIVAEMNVSNLCEKFNALSDADIEQVIKDSCLEIEGKAKRKCPVDTGELRQSIETNVYSEGKTTVGEVGSNKLYAPYVCFGSGLFSENGDGRKDVPWHYQDAEGNWYTTSGQLPQPYLKPAFDEVKPSIEKKIRDCIKTQI